MGAQLLLCQQFFKLYRCYGRGLKICGLNKIFRLFLQLFSQVELSYFSGVKFQSKLIDSWNLVCATPLTILCQYETLQITLSWSENGHVFM